MIIPRKKEKGNIFYSLGAWSYPSSVPIINKFHLSVVSQRSYMIHFYASLNCNWLWLSDPTPLCRQTLKSHPLHNLHIPLMRFSMDLPMFLKFIKTSTPEAIVAGVDCLGPVPYPDWPSRSPPTRPPRPAVSSTLGQGRHVRAGFAGGGDRQGQLMPNVSRSHAAQCSQRLEEEEGRESKKQDSPSPIRFFPPAPPCG